MKITEFLKENTLLLDGGMGTLLQAEGLGAGELPERRNLTHPQQITAIHSAYLQAGARVISTNTFGANSLKFSDSELGEIISAAVANARAATRAIGGEERWVALDIGPTGRMLKPYGDLDFEEAVAIFSKTVRLGAACGVDLILIETMNDSYECKAALLAAKESCDLPVFVSCAYGADGKLMTGADPAAMVAMLEGMGADAIGVNCSLGPRALAPVVEDYLRYASVPVLLKPNAGLPRVENGRTVYDLTPDAFAADVAALVARGVRAVGGCCGTTPDYIRALKQACEGIAPLPLTQKNLTAVSSYTHAVFFGNGPVLIGERINPTGKKAFKEALRARDINYILREGITQQERGVHILDVNVGLPEIDEAEMLTTAVCELQAVCDLPLQIDTSDPVAMERALRRYNGRPMLNSVNGKRESMEAVFPLAKKYGALVVALTLDESGIPADAAERVEIARRILAEAARYGLSAKDLVFDPLALTVSADTNAAVETLCAVERIHNELGCHTSLGVSNVSFGLPARDLVNGTFFTMALAKGLSAAIMNPYSTEMMKAYAAYRTLSGQDEACADYIAFAAQYAAAASTPVTGVPSAPAEPTQTASELQDAIVKGLRERAAALTADLLCSRAPLEIVNDEVIPALNTVGEGFENKRVYLPQLLMSAEAAKAAFEVVRGAAEATAATKGCVVLATVKGDIHDIGKNIVRLLLENYGYAVCDLGRDVSPEAIVGATVERHAPLVGLSALMTTTVPAMEETVALLRERAPWCKIMVGGAVLTRELAERIGAHAYARDAMEAVRCAEQLLGE
ncbi:MAG: homocysteine S-methyltransferase family protein [Clostridia bacterium]|nr:homocysteine S-methyltransferase family protein [Clostridia bacterium]